MTIWRLGASGEDPPDGLYKDLLSEAIARQLDGLAARMFRVGRDVVSAEEAPEHLVRGIAQALRIALDGITGKEAAERRLGLANDLLRRIVAAAPEEFRDGEGALRSELLRSLQRPNALGETGPEPGRPRTALSRSELFVNAERHGVLQELASEIPSADRIDLVCAFVKWSGFVKVRDALQAHCERRRKLRVLTTTYLGASDARAIEELRAIARVERWCHDIDRPRALADLVAKALPGAPTADEHASGPLEGDQERVPRRVRREAPREVVDLAGDLAAVDEQRLEEPAHGAADPGAGARVLEGPHAVPRARAQFVRSTRMRQVRVPMSVWSSSC